MLLARFTDSRLLAAWLLVLFHVWTGTHAGVCLAAEDEEPEAEESTETVADAGEIVVEDAAPSPALLYDDPSATTERIEIAPVRERYPDLAALLEDLAGVQVVSFGGVGRSQSISLRGSTGKQVLVLLDGVPLNSAGEAFDLSTIPLDQLEAVEITKGSVGALYGGGAVGGAINLIPKSGTADEAENGGAWRLEAGSELTTGATLTGWRPDPTEPLLWQLQTQHTRGDFRYRDDSGTTFNQSDDVLRRRDNNEADTTSVLLRQAWKASDGTESTTATFSGFWRQRGEPGIVTFPSPTSSQKDDRWLVDLTWRRSDWLIAGSESEVKLFGRLNRTLFQDPNGEQTGVPISLQQEDTLYGLRLGTVVAADEEWIWTALLEGSAESLNDRSPQVLEGGGDHDRTTVAAGLRGEWMFDPEWTILSALRGDWLSDQPDRVSPRVGVVYQPDVAWTFRASAGNGYRPPSFAELADARGFVVGNPDLRPEVSRSFELSGAYEDDNTSVTASLFRTDTRDLIEYVQLSGFRFKPLNFGRARGEGLELAVNRTMSERWTIEGAWTWQEIVDATGGANRSGALIPGRPRQFGQSTLVYTDGGFESTLSWHYVGRNSVTLSNSKFLEDRDTLDWSAVWTEGPDKLSLQVSNLFDAETSDLRGFPLPGTTWLLAYTRSW